jgi:hypothetical protein
MRHNKKGEVMIMIAVGMFAVFCGMSWLRSHQTGRTVDTVEHPGPSPFVTEK